MNPSDRTVLIRFASTFPKGSKARRAILAGLLGFPKDAGKFALGRMVQTRGVAHKARENREFGREVQDALRKYVRGDWGKSKDKRMNDQAVKNGDERIMGVYPTDEGDIWIITEWDRSATTILFPSEY